MHYHHYGDGRYVVRLDKRRIRNFSYSLAAEQRDTDALADTTYGWVASRRDRSVAVEGTRVEAVEATLVGGLGVQAFTRYVSECTWSAGRFSGERPSQA